MIPHIDVDVDVMTPLLKSTPKGNDEPDHEWLCRQAETLRRDPIQAETQSQVRGSKNCHVNYVVVDADFDAVSPVKSGVVARSHEVYSDYRGIFSSPYLKDALTYARHKMRMRREQQFRMGRRNFYMVEVNMEGKFIRSFQTSTMLRYIRSLCGEANETTIMQNLQIRDVRQVFSGTTIYSIEPRHNCILVNLPPYKCVILPSAVLFLISSEANICAMGSGQHLATERTTPQRTPTTENHAANEQLGCIDHLSDGIVGIITNPSDMSPVDDDGLGSVASRCSEFRILEILLLDVCRRLWSRVEPMGKQARSLDRVRDMRLGGHSYASFLHEVKGLQKGCDVLLMEVKSAQNSLTDLLEDPHDSLGIVFSQVNGRDFGRQQHHPDDLIGSPVQMVRDSNEDCQRVITDNFSKKVSRRLTSRREPLMEQELVVEVELMIECYVQELGGCRQVLKQTESDVDDALLYVELHLNSRRNQLLKYEVGLNWASVWFSAVAALTGLFGMNLRSGLEESQDVFWRLTVLIAIMTCVITTVITKYFYPYPRKLKSS